MPNALHYAIEASAIALTQTVVRARRPRARNPRFLMLLFGQKNGFRARNAGMNEIKSGIPCSAPTCPPPEMFRD
jgi:hypothetical protein